MRRPKSIYMDDIIKIIKTSLFNECNLITFVQMLADYYKKTNPYFNRKEFYYKCGLTNHMLKVKYKDLKVKENENNRYA